MQQGEIEVVVSYDEDAHFLVANINNRLEVIQLLKQVEGGDFLANEINGNITLELERAFKLSDADWKNWLNHLTCRGRLEIVPLNI